MNNNKDVEFDNTETKDKVNKLKKQLTKAKIDLKNMKGLNFCDMLGLLFIGLKLCDKINWNWSIVLLPLWLQIIFILPCYIALAIGSTVAKEAEKKLNSMDTKNN